MHQNHIELLSNKLREFGYTPNKIIGIHNPNSTSIHKIN